MHVKKSPYQELDKDGTKESYMQCCRPRLKSYANTTSIELSKIKLVNENPKADIHLKDSSSSYDGAPTNSPFPLPP